MVTWHGVEGMRASAVRKCTSTLDRLLDRLLAFWRLTAECSIILLLLENVPSYSLCCERDRYQGRAESDGGFIAISKERRSFP